ncbi:SSS sodium solute transporter superfamily [Halothece sp. PCC 7418]|uniref:sodium:solute symporter n=1 Tax=Halothece sp. (strain PCC 7418) TaxID=65093 RepID=UPI0002A064CC|nr:sodium:solute symporter [Halothece sp. PCC 7418]AFZ43428.1 SSS sodium solute transporter superfamily [Halothece sp. PCC 7418]
MGIIDWSIVGIYALIVIGIGVMASRKQNNTNEYFRGGRQLPWWAIGFSIIATSFSAASLLGGPGQGYGHGFLYLQLQLGDLIGYGLVIALFLPFFVNLNLTTAYEYLEQRFDAKTRSLGSLCFLLFVIARLGALLYGASLVVSTVTGIPLYPAIALVGVISILYTVTGGITAVVWTDVLQFAMIFVGLGAGIWAAVSGVDGGFGTLLQAAGEADKLKMFNLSWDPASIYSLPTALFAYGILAFAVAGTNQQSVQRYVSCSDLPSARKAILFGWFSGFLGMAATLLLGVILFGFYSLNGGLSEEIAGDKILPYFIVNQVPVGASGFLVAAIFAAAMSSIDSALHSLATCMTVDFYDRYFLREENESKSLRVAQLLIMIWGILGILSAFYVASTGKDLLPFLVTYTTIFLGPLLGIFLMGVLLPRVNANGAFYGTVTAVIFMIIASEAGWLTFPGIWRSAITAPIAVILGSGISLFGSIPPPRSIQGLTLWTQISGNNQPMSRPGLEE